MVAFCRKYPELPEVRERERVNGLVLWGREPVLLSTKKVFKAAIGGPGILPMILAATSALERMSMPRLLDRAYRLLLGLHIQRGYREGSPWRLLHFAEDGDTSGFFPQLGQRYDRTRYEMTFGH